MKGTVEDTDDTSARQTRRAESDPKEGAARSLVAPDQDQQGELPSACPFATVFFVFTVLPVIMSIFLSFTHYNMLQPPVWVGWANYIRLFLADDVFLIALKNTFVFASITGPVSYFACLIFAG